MNKVKYVYFFLIFFYIGFHFIAPGAYYILVRYVPTYQKEIFDLGSMEIGFWVNVLGLSLGSLLIYLTKYEFPIYTNFKYRSRLYLLLTIIFLIGAYFTIGGFSNALNGLKPPTGFFIFYGMFFSLDLYILFSLVMSSDFFCSSQLIYVFRNLVFGSRSAALSLFLLYIYSSWSQNSFKYFKQYALFLLLALSLSLFSFSWATKLRSKNFQSTSMKMQITESFKVSNSLIEKIVGRVSFLESAMLPIYFKKTNSPGLEIFYEKYGINNQLKLVLNNILPIKFFPFDVYPNQYFRSAFMGMPQALARSYYTSINITLPVYFYMYSNFYVAILLSGLAIWVYYLLTLLAFKVHPLVGAVFVYAFYGSFLTYFDWIMLIKGGVIGILSACVFMLTSFFETKFLHIAELIKKRRNS